MIGRDAIQVGQHQITGCLIITSYEDLIFHATKTGRIEAVPSLELFDGRLQLAHLGLNRKLARPKQNTVYAEGQHANKDSDHGHRDQQLHQRETSIPMHEMIFPWKHSDHHESVHAGEGSGTPKSRDAAAAVSSAR